MALATYALCYNNVNVFRGVVKLRRGEYFVIGIFRKHKLVIALYNPHSFFFFSYFLFINTFVLLSNWLLVQTIASYIKGMHALKNSNFVINV